MFELKIEQSVQERVIDVFKKVINIDGLEDKSIRELYLCPHDLVHLMCRLEEIFGIKIDDKDAEKFQTVKDVCVYVEKLVSFQ